MPAPQVPCQHACWLPSASQVYQCQYGVPVPGLGFLASTKSGPVGCARNQISTLYLFSTEARVLGSNGPAVQLSPLLILINIPLPSVVF